MGSKILRILEYMLAHMLRPVGKNNGIMHLCAGATANQVDTSHESFPSHRSRIINPSKNYNCRSYKDYPATS